MHKIIFEESLQIVAFSLFDSKSSKKEEFGILIEQVREIRPMESITRIPHTQNYVCGMMNLRGAIIPVIDMKRKLGFSDDHIVSPNTRILVVDIEGKLAGLLIDEVDQVKRITPKEIETNLRGGLESIEYITGVAKVSGRLVVLLDVVKLLRDMSLVKEV